MYAVMFILVSYLLIRNIYCKNKGREGGNKEYLSFPQPVASTVDEDHQISADLAYEQIWPRYVTSDFKENDMLRNALNEKQKFLKTVKAGTDSGLTDENVRWKTKDGVYYKAQGWWEDAVNCEQSQSTLYCKPKKLWIWPY